VIERIAQRGRHGARPRLEFLPVAGVAGAEALVDPVRAHRPPLVVIAFQPDLGDGAELVIARDLRDGQVAVVVDDRQVGDGAVIEVARDVIVEQEIVVDERLHWLFSVLVERWALSPPGTRDTLRQCPAG
jgi:hypothetical protein